MTCHSGMNTSGQNVIKIKVKITMSFYGKRNEIISRWHFTYDHVLS
jgi:hypothetical protein